METNRTWLKSLFLERIVEYRAGKTVTAAPSPALDMQVAMTQPNCGRNDTAIHSRMNLMKNKLLNAPRGGMLLEVAFFTSSSRLDRNYWYATCLA